MGTFLSVCAVLVVSAFLAVFVLVVLGGTVCGKSIGHDVFGWHDCAVDDPAARIKTGKCRYCGRKCEMDWEGNWHLAEGPGDAA